MIQTIRIYFFRWLRPPQAMLELAAITLLGLLYISLWMPGPKLDSPDGLATQRLANILLNPNLHASGLEHERLAGVILPIKIGLQRYGHIPTWNPYLTGGEPLLNNAFNYLLNPFHSLPMLLVDNPVQGSKLTVTLALLLAGYNMWALARAIGIGAIGRVMAGALYLMSGGLAAKFYAGHFQLGLSLAWPPLVLAGLWWTLHTPDRRAPIMFALAFALLYFAGNIYYTLHTLVGCAIITVLHVLEREGAHWHFCRDRLKRIGIAGLFTVGLTAPQLIPTLAVASPRLIVHDIQSFTDPGRLENSYTLAQAAANLIFPWDAWRTFENFKLSAVVDYAYIGPAVFLLIIMAAPLVRKWRVPVRAIWSALILAVTMMIWGSGQTPILEWLYANLPLLSEFRFLGRALSLAALGWVLLAAISIDGCWHSLRENLHVPPGFDAYDRARFLRALLVGLLAWLYLLIYSTASLTSRQNLALHNYALLNLLDHLRFTNFNEALAGLWALLWIALFLDTALLFLTSLLGSLHLAINPLISWRSAGVRLLRLGLFTLALLALLDSAQVNSQLFVFEPVLADFTPLYQYAHQHDSDTPYPAILEPHSSLAFAAYQAEVNNWGLNEGWEPGATKGLIPVEAGELQDLPRWAIVSNFYGNRPRELAQEFVAQHGYDRRQCLALDRQAQTDPCNENGEPLTAVLYERVDVLPYAFVVTAKQLRTHADQLRRDDVQPVTVLSHQQDTITLQAQTAPDAYLIVRENHFPGWQAWVDGIPTQTFTAETSHSPDSYQGFIAVPVQPGEHTYTLYYQPPGLIAGILIFLITILFVGLYLFPRYRIKIRGHIPPSR